LDDDVLEFLKQKGISVDDKQVYLSVGRYKHLLRDVKKQAGKAIPNEIGKELYKSINNPYNIYFDNKKEKLNLIYIDKKQGSFFKIIIQPNYKTKKGYKNYILTAGIIKEKDLNDKFLEKLR